MSGYKIEFEQTPFQYKSPNEIPFNEEKRRIVGKEVDTLLEKGAIIRSEHEPNEFISTIFVVPKPNGKFRPVINLRFLNEFVRYEHFKQETFKVVLDLVQEQDFFTSIDLQDAYFSVPIDEDDQKYLKFSFEDELYKFVCLPFGLSSAPKLFTKILKPVYAWFRFHGIRCSYYIDDSLNLNQSKDLCQTNSNTIMEVLKSLGFPINQKKSILEPTQRIVFFGFVLDSVLFMVFLTEEKVEKILRSARELLTQKMVVVRSVASFIGRVVNAFFAVLEAPMYYRSLERDKIRGLGKDYNFDNFVELSSESREELVWWVENVAEKNGKRIRPVKVSFNVFTDASELGWGCYISETKQHANGRWNLEEKNYHINFLELLAVFYTLKTFFTRSRGIHIEIHSDNVGCVSYIRDMGGMASVVMDRLARQIWEWCTDRNIFLSSVHVPGLLNVNADFHSRNFSDSTEWMLKKEVFSRLCKHFFLPDIDLFASRLNKQIDKFISWFPEPGCHTSDAFSVAWKEFNPYIFPPFSMIGKVLNKVIEDEVDQALLVFPFWKSQAWYPLLLSTMISFPVRLPRHKDLLVLAHNEMRHPLKKLNMTAAVVSGRACRVEEFRQELQRSSCQRGNPAPGSSMAWHGESGVFGVVGETLITFNRLKV